MNVPTAAGTAGVDNSELTKPEIATPAAGPSEPGLGNGALPPAL